MNFFVLTLFPQMVEDGLNHSILKRAAQKDIICVTCVDIRDFSSNNQRQVDDYPYGGGVGMVMMPDPIYAAWKHVADLTGPGTRVVYMTPQGAKFDQRKAVELSKERNIIFLCGHYEGVDERVIEEIVTDEISIGDYILTGGELGAMVCIDAVARLIPGVLGKEASHLNESFANNLLEYPQYTRPVVFNGRRVPDVLLSGHHKNIQEWRVLQSVERTRKRRPDMIEQKGESTMKGIITVVGNDQKGIIAKVCTYLSNEGINILDISQTIVQGYFNMMMIVDLSEHGGQFEDVSEALNKLGEGIGVVIRLQHEDIFNSMHRI